MKWMRERDLLIAQTMAFVQSVTGKTPEAEKTVTTSVALLSVETSETIRTAAALPDAALSDIKSLLAVTPPAAQAPREASREVSREEIPREISRPAPLARLDLREDFQSEIRARVANFRAHQERFNREREAYCSATMAKVHAALREGEPPTRPGKIDPGRKTALPGIRTTFSPNSEPGIDERHVGRAGDQQADGQRELNTLTGGLEARSHGRKHPAILAVESRGLFFPGFTTR